MKKKENNLSARTVDLVGPTAEISGMGSTKYEDVNINTHWTVSVKLGQNGVSHAEGRGIMSAENNEVGTYSINGIATSNSSGGSSSSRGVSLFTMEELKIIGNLCETMKHWRRHNPEVSLPDSLYEQLETIQDKCTKARKAYS